MYMYSTTTLREIDYDEVSVNPLQKEHGINNKERRIASGHVVAPLSVSFKA